MHITQQVEYAGLVGNMWPLKREMYVWCLPTHLIFERLQA